MTRILTTLAAFLAALNLMAGEAPLWMRYPSISPDGEKIAFTYKGSIYIVDSEGGEAMQLTQSKTYDYEPVWSPDSKTLAFASNRYGNFDVYTIPATGGIPQRLTTNSASEIPYAFSHDGKRVYFGATIADPAESAIFPKATMNELYSVSVNGGRPEQVLASPVQYMSVSKDGRHFLYQDRKGGENIWRKHHTSSITRDIWLYDTQTGEHTQLIDRPGEDRNPCYSPSGDSFYFLSERSGTFNVWQMPVSADAQAKQITKFDTHPVRFLSVAQNGTLCFGFNGEIYTMAAGSQPEKLKVCIKEVDANDAFSYLPVSGGTGAVISPDGKQIAFVSRGEVFVTSVDYATTKQITHTAESEISPTFSADSRSLAYGSERDGRWNIYVAEIARSEDASFPYATLIDEKPLFENDGIERSYPQYSPDGKELAFVQDRCRLMVKNLETGKVRQITDGSQHYSTSGAIDYSWSPDGKWFCLSYTANRHEPYSDVGIVSAEGGEIFNVTESGYFDMAPEWVLDGNAILFATDRYGMRSHASWGSLEDVMIVYMNREAFEVANMDEEEYEIYKEAKKEAEKAKKAAEEKDDKKSVKKGKKSAKDDKKVEKEADKKEIVIEFEGMGDRIVRLTPFSANMNSYVLDAKDENLIYSMTTVKGPELWKLNLRDGSHTMVNKGVNGRLVWDQKKEYLYALSSSRMVKMKGPSGSVESVPVKCDMKLDYKAEREYMFNRIYQQEKQRFYREDLHGVDWEGLCENYRRFLPYITNNYDFAEMASELLGELNVSHTGCSYYAPQGTDASANLGLFYDYSYRGKGLKVTEVLAGGPMDKASCELKAGDVIEKIDGAEILEDTDYYPMLNRKAGKRVLLSVYRPSDGKRWEEVVEPVSNSTVSKLLYKRWVKQRAADVERLSGGRLGYVHIEGMNDDSFRTIYSDILGKYNHCEGIVIDTRFNGGGRLHEDIEVLFSGKKYLTQVVRGKESCDMPSRRWNKASIMITGEANYSNAHGTPWVYQVMGIGKVVGMPVPGTMTSVNWERLQDPTLVFGIPVTGYRLEDGSYLENKQLEPDYKIANSPEEVVKGRDEQLEAAVRILLEQIDSEKE